MSSSMLSVCHTFVERPTPVFSRSTSLGDRSAKTLASMCGMHCKHTHTHTHTPRERNIKKGREGGRGRGRERARDLKRTTSKKQSADKFSCLHHG